MVVEVSVILNPIRLVPVAEKRGHICGICPCPSVGTLSAFHSGLVTGAVLLSSPHQLPLFPFLSVYTGSSTVLCEMEFKSPNYIVGLMDWKRFFLPAYFSLRGNRIYCFN